MNSAESRAQEIGGGQGAQGGISVAELQDAAKQGSLLFSKFEFSIKLDLRGLSFS